jgi:ectoine hydroxylase-related dioxygenase (phytanoyl-CoA dioxygenase family)
MTDSLNPQQLARYREDGFLFPLDLLDSHQTGQALDQLQQVESGFDPTNLTKKVSQYLRINAHVLFPFVYNIARLATMLDKVERILGPNILIYSAELFIKEPQTPKIVSWHQDLTYWGLGETDDELTAWVALSEVNVESGCMRFLPGSHKQAIQPHQDSFHEDNLLSRGQEIAVDVDEKDTVKVELKPGQVSFHHGRMFHASGPNQSNNRRIGVAIRYVTPEVKQQFGERDYVMMARGIDSSGNWIHLTPPSNNFDAGNMAIYEHFRQQQMKVIMRDAKQQTDLYPVDASAN